MPRINSGSAFTRFRSDLPGIVLAEAQGGENGTKGVGRAATHRATQIGPWGSGLLATPASAVARNATASRLTRIRDRWRELLEAQGVQWRRPGVQDHEELEAELKVMGAQVEAAEVLRYHATATPRERLDQIHSRVCSDAWDVPDEVFEATFEEITAWTKNEIGPLDRPITEERRFTLRIARFQ